MKTYFKTLFKRHIRDPQRNKKGEFNYYGEQVYFPTDSLIFRIAMEEGGVYERDNLKLIQLFLKPGTTLFDVGANIGMMAVPILYSQPSLKVLSVEASPNSLNYLKKTRDAASFKNRWQIIDKAVADKPGVVDFHISKSANGALDGLRNTERAEIVDTIKVECTTLDTIWNEQQQPEVSFIKIDIEGADLLALQGAKDCIGQCRPVILMEWNQTNIIPFGFTNADLLTFVKSINYEIFYLPEIRKISSLPELNLLCKLHYIENYLLIPAEKQD